MARDQFHTQNVVFSGWGHMSNTLENIYRYTSLAVPCSISIMTEPVGQSNLPSYVFAYIYIYIRIFHHISTRADPTVTVLCFDGVRKGPGGRSREAPPRAPAPTLGPESEKISKMIFQRNGFLPLCFPMAPSWQNCETNASQTDKWQRPTKTHHLGKQSQKFRGGDLPDTSEHAQSVAGISAKRIYSNLDLDQSTSRVALNLLET